MSNALDLFPNDHPWTLEDLERLPESTNRYEITNGSLLVTPPPAIRHVVVTANLDRALEAQSPPNFKVFAVGAGVQLPRSMYIPDIVVVHASAAARDGKVFEAGEAVLVVEVLSPSNAGTDLVLKRHDYAAAGIPWYWIVDPEAETITVLENTAPGGRTGSYIEREIAKSGAEWSTVRPFQFTVDPGSLR